MNYVIEKNVPLAEKKSKACKYPFREMEIGDSFSAPITEKTKIRNNIYTYSRILNRKFTARIVENDTSGLAPHVRVWRIA